MLLIMVNGTLGMEWNGILNVLLPMLPYQEPMKAKGQFSFYAVWSCSGVEALLNFSLGTLDLPCTAIVGLHALSSNIRWNNAWEAFTHDDQYEAEMIRKVPPCWSLRAPYPGHLSTRILHPPSLIR